MPYQYGSTPFKKVKTISLIVKHFIFWEGEDNYFIFSFKRDLSELYRLNQKLTLKYYSDISLKRVSVVR